jgi:hypothetical protein
LVSHLEIAGSF